MNNEKNITYKTFKEAAEALKTTVIPERYLFKDIPFKADLAAQDFKTMNEKNGIYFVGDIGRGKTVRMYNLWLYMKLALGSFDYRFINTADLFAKLKSDFDSMYYEMEKLKKYKYLFLDDFGVERGTDFEMERLYELINAKYLNCTFLILSSNVPRGDWMAKNGDTGMRIGSRLAEMTTVIKVDGPDLRLK